VKQNKGIIRRFFSHALLWLNILAVVWLAVCYLASIINPAQVRNVALFSLTTPFAVFINICFLIFWLFTSHKLRSLFSLVILGMCFKVIPAVFGFHYFRAQDWAKAPGRLKIVSWNVHGMGIFSPASEKRYAKGIVSFVVDEDPDILCLPEFAVKASTKKSVYFKEIVRENQYPYFRFIADNSLGTKVLLGTAFFSRFPILNSKAYELDPYIIMMQCDVQVTPDQIIRVFAAHLHSFGLTDRDKAYIEKVKADSDLSTDIDRSRSFVWKFNEAYIMRSKEADKVASIIKASPYPVLICGDFNDLPFSYTYSKIRGDMNDAFVNRGKGFGRTYNQIIPTLRIDHIFYNPAVLNIIAFKSPYSALSDHSPVIANFEIIPTPRH
jgi:endonuclease/exonuclease/phosphatase family metal-dependent hydrolase